MDKAEERNRIGQWGCYSRQDEQGRIRNVADKTGGTGEDIEHVG